MGVRLIFSRYHSQSKWQMQQISCWLLTKYRSINLKLSIVCNYYTAYLALYLNLTFVSSPDRLYVSTKCSYILRQVSRTVATKLKGVCNIHFNKTFHTEMVFQNHQCILSNFPVPHVQRQGTYEIHQSTPTG